MTNAIEPIHPYLPEQLNTGMSGITIREYFAGLAMQGILANKSVQQQFFKDSRCETSMMPHDFAAEMSVQYADALIAELNKIK